MLQFLCLLSCIILSCQGGAISRNSNVNLYYLYTQTNSRTPELISATTAAVQGSSISLERPTVFLVHGHEGSAFTSLNPTVKDAVLSVEDVNLIVVDWSTYANLPYSSAVAKVPTIADSLVSFIHLLAEEEESESPEEEILPSVEVIAPSVEVSSPEVEEPLPSSEVLPPGGENSPNSPEIVLPLPSGDVLPPGGETPFLATKGRSSKSLDSLPLNNIHLVGFGLGAHIVGAAGRLLNGQVARITGLDPTGSLWGSNSARLRASDARYVEVIHTDGSGLLSNGIGEVLGDIDFFANGGSNQPGCLTHSCCHNRAYELFAASMVNENLVGQPCSSSLQLSLNLCRGPGVRMGGNDLQVDKIGSGVYRVNTGRRWPF